MYHLQKVPKIDRAQLPAIILNGVEVLQHQAAWIDDREKVCLSRREENMHIHNNHQLYLYKKTYNVMFW